MSELLEYHIELPACDYAKARGWYCEKIMKCGRNGFPDRFFARDGVIILIEFKRPGKDATEQQKKRHRELRAAGVTVHVVDNLIDAKRILK